MPLISDNTRGALVEMAVKLVQQVVNNGTELLEGESVTADISADGTTIAIAATINGAYGMDSLGNPQWIIESSPNDGSFIP